MAKEIGCDCGDTKPSSRGNDNVKEYSSMCYEDRCAESISPSTVARELKRAAEVKIADIIRKLESDIDMEVRSVDIVNELERYDGRRTYFDILLDVKL
jgi:hypothetical protein